MLTGATSEVLLVLCGGSCVRWLWGVPGLLQVGKDLVDSFESIIQVFCGTAVAEEFVAVGVFDKEVGVPDVVAEVSDFVES